MLEYKLPNLQQNPNLFRTMHPDDLFKMRDEIQFHLGTVMDAATEALQNNIESCCDICAGFGYAHLDLPSNWGWLENGTLICNKCVQKWTDKFGEAPVLNKQGELVYDDSSLSEDTAHRGQANFDFI